MNQIEKINSMKYTENGDKAYKSTGDNLLDILVEIIQVLGTHISNKMQAKR